MDKEIIKKELTARHTVFTDYLFSLSNEAFLTSYHEKWAAGQQLEHIYLSVKPVRQALGMPKILLRFLLGKANRSGRNYDELVDKYRNKLQGGGKAPGRFVPKVISIEKGQQLKTALAKEIARLCSKLDRFTEEELDRYILPHPLLGKLTLREMMYFTLYHVGHHQELARRYLDMKAADQKGVIS